jgi:hypothetical protein
MDEEQNRRWDVSIVATAIGLVFVAILIGLLIVAFGDIEGVMI